MFYHLHQKNKRNNYLLNYKYLRKNVINSQNKKIYDC